MNRREETNKVINELNSAINMLSVTNDADTKNKLLGYMRCKLYDLYILNNLEPEPCGTVSGSPARNIRQNTQTFTKQELAAYNGKNGVPSYVAVNGIVYDVTNNAAWGAATHFGLSVGNDLTAQFSSCHAGQPILQNLPQVGRMIGE